MKKLVKLQLKTIITTICQIIFYTSLIITLFIIIENASLVFPNTFVAIVVESLFFILMFSIAFILCLLTNRHNFGFSIKKISKYSKYRIAIRLLVVICYFLAGFAICSHYEIVYKLLHTLKLSGIYYDIGYNLRRIPVYIISALMTITYAIVEFLFVKPKYENNTVC